MNLFLIMMAVVLVVIFLDLTKKINLMNGVLITIFVLLALNPVALGYLFYHNFLMDYGVLEALGVTGPLIFFVCYLWVRMNLYPFREKTRTNFRLRVMMGGLVIARSALWSMTLQIFLMPFFYHAFIPHGYIGNFYFADSIITILLFILFYYNGIIRIIFTSRRLGIVFRIIMLMSMWVPILNIPIILYGCRLVYEEYDCEVNRVLRRSMSVDSHICQTKYPIILVHGILFRDLKYFNYWGRIPAELYRYGADTYHSNLEAVGTVENNAQDLKMKIFEIMEKTGAPKVNIIAHSKGGLDARHTISNLDMGQYVASLTTVCTPHRGCRFVDYACRLPEGMYRFTAKIFDNAFRRLGDKNPDFYTATRQFSTVDSRAFNNRTIDSPQVYYQSYMSKMRSVFSFPALGILYLLIKALEGDNDGLVSVEAAKWGNYMGLIETKGNHGISHGDIIDLKRQDYKGYDILEIYVDIVSKLKAKGF